MVKFVPESRFHHLPSELQTYVIHVAHTLHTHLGEDLIGVYLVGSTALGGYLPGKSDIDIQGVCSQPLSPQAKTNLTAQLAHPTLACPTRGCELVLYRKEQVANSTPIGGFEINLNSGPQMPLHVSYDPTEESPHWFLIDRAIAREHGICIYGPPASELFSRIPRTELLEALLISLNWHAKNDEIGASSVLNACRALRYAQEERWTSKMAAAEWAIASGADGDLLSHAMALRAGTTQTPLEQVSVKTYLTFVKERVEQQLAAEQRNSR